MFRTLGARLTTFATGITLAVSLLVCAALYLGIRHSLYQEVDTFLAGEVNEFRAILAAAGTDLDDVQRRVRVELGSRQRADLTFRLLDAAGRVLLTSDASSALPNPWPLPPQPPADILLRTETGSELAAHTRTGSQWIRSIDGSTQIVQATYLLDQVNASLTRFLQISAAALGLAAIAAALGGRLLATRGLRPVSQMVRAAQQITVENLQQRLDRSGTGDELDVLAATFNTMFDRLERQVAQIRQFTADAAHELRTPLAALRGNAELALHEPRSADELRTAIADSIDEYDRLARIASDLLLLARADAGQEFVRRTPMRLDAAIGDIADLFAPLADDNGITLDCQVAGEIWIDGDSDRIRQMVVNLVDNALKYTPAGGRVGVRLSTTERQAVLTVSDTGVGIAPEHLPFVFDRFYRAERARTPGRGAGLGLSISRTIVEAHLGTIELSSRQSMGTTVRVEIPLPGERAGRSTPGA